MNIPSRSKSHIFIGLVDKTKYRYEHLSNYNLQLINKIIHIYI